MGAAIYLFLETDSGMTGELEVFACFDLPRYPHLYALLGNQTHVERVGLQPVFPLRGLPEVTLASMKTMEEVVMISDCSKVSWLTVDEVWAVMQKAKEFGVFPEFAAIYAAMRSLRDNESKTRLVYCFDQ